MFYVSIKIVILLFWYEFICRQEQDLFDLKKAVLRPKDTKDEKQTFSTKETLERVNALYRYMYITRLIMKISKQSIPNKIHISIFHLWVSFRISRCIMFLLEDKNL